MKKKLRILMTSVCVFMLHALPVFAADDLTRKLNTGKTWFIGIAEIGAVINVIYAIWACGDANTPDEIQKAQGYRKKSIRAFIGITVAMSIIALWKSW